MAKPTYSVIAARAGVGTATVERVLNGRGGIRPGTAEKVVLAARELDWPGRLPEKHRGIIRLDVILVRPETSFLLRLARSFRRIASTLDQLVHVQITTLEERDPDQIANFIRSPSVRRSGLIVYSPSHSAVRNALEQEMAAGLPVVQVVTRVSDDAEFVGIDNFAVGQSAGLMLARLSEGEGKVVAVCHSAVYEVHRERIAGFSKFMAADQRHHLDFSEVVFGLDDRDMTEARLQDVFAQSPEVVGIYNAGGANVGVLRALDRFKKQVFFVGHELNEVTSQALKQGRAGVIFDQLPETQARRAIDLILSRIGLTDEVIENPPIRFTTVTQENV